MQPFLGPVFLTLTDFCWLIELARDGHDVNEALQGFMRSADITFTNFASRFVQRGLPAWMDVRAQEHFEWLGEATRG